MSPDSKEQLTYKQIWTHVRVLKKREMFHEVVMVVSRVLREKYPTDTSITHHKRIKERLEYLYNLLSDESEKASTTIENDKISVCKLKQCLEYAAFERIL